MNNMSLDQTATKPVAKIDDKSLTMKAALVAGIVAAISASACCAGPLLLLMLGVSGSWIGNLSALEAYRPLFILIALVCIGLAFRKIYRQPASCSVDSVCATPQGKQLHRVIFWLTSLIIVIAIAFPWYGPLLFDN